ncbi:ABC transporter substrate-binding protein [Desulfopila aestuarii]|uniref:Branched-chain amino acid transport system substrate-binding protein n=1 Tax=Desulfopila aestuarii DSM 18488 TaxID=1121416 RepID=A0A1M7YAW7_9BACT|nr:ABC transporter substrate-binding protein [Desulfopila aestuarii]SHO49752.1 branched-chain amino acid transport system substrate-binding protein [Desulfopila aestuarii DSM 18488]
MRKRLISPAQAGLVLLLTFMFSSIGQAENTIKIGLNLAFTGGRESSGLATRAGAEMAKDTINNAGGVTIGGKKYVIEYIYADNKSNVQQAVDNVIKLITVEKVVAIIGPNDSSRAIPAGGISQSFKTPMLSPMSTNPTTTLDRPYVFRACFLDPFQGQAMANFATTEFDAKKAAVFFDIADAYPRGLADFFKTAFLAKHGEGSIVAYEDFHSNETDYSAHMKRIMASGADVLFVPQYDNQIPEIVKQAAAAGWNKPILGGDAWETSTLMEQCGDQCKGYFFTSHFAAVGAKGKSLEFVEAFKAKTGKNPTADGALGYDAASLLITAIANVGSISDNLLTARTTIKDSLASVKGFQGVTGTLDMTAGGDPIKSGVVIRINDQGAFESYKIENPEI